MDHEDLAQLLPMFVDLPGGFPLEILLEPIAEAIAGCYERMRQLPDDADRDWAEMVGYEESSKIEGLQGASLVLSQTSMIATIESLRMLHRFVSKYVPSLVLRTSDGTFQGLLHAESPLVGDTGRTEVEVIHAFANYFKHHAEWDLDVMQSSQCWAVRDRTRLTIETIRAAGVTDGDSLDLGCCLAALGDPERRRVDVLADAVDGWRDRLYAAYRQELSEAGYLED